MKIFSYISNLNICPKTDFVKFYTGYPIIFFLSFYVSGIIAGYIIPSDIITLSALTAVAVVFIYFYCGKMPSSLAFIVFIVFIAGFIRIRMFDTSQVPLISKGFPVFYKKVSIVGTVYKPLEKLKTKTRLFVKTSRILAGKRELDIKWKIRITVYDSEVPSIMPEDKILIRSVRLKKPRNYKNPGMFDYKGYLWKKGINVIGSVSKAKYIKILDKSQRKNSLKYYLYLIREEMKGFILKNSPPSAASHLLAMSLGERSYLTKEDKERFNNSGLSHLFAISGLHIGFCASFSFLIICRFLFIICYYTASDCAYSGSYRRFAAFLSFLPVISYSVLVGYSASTARALIMVLCYLFSIIIKREDNILNTTGLAALIILVLYPGSLFDVGFQLSFLVVFIIILSYNKIHYSDKKDNILHTEPTLFKRMKKGFKEFFYITIFASLGTYPIIQNRFYRIALYSAGANLIAVPICSIIITGTIICCIISIASPYIASILLNVPIFLLNIVLKTADIFLSLPFSALFGPSCRLSHMTLYYLSFFILLTAKRCSRSALLAIQSAIFISICLTPLYPQKAVSDGILRVTFIDVGQGESTFIKFPYGNTMLIDGGGTNNSFDKGDRIILPYLFNTRINNIDYVVSTHPDNDHIGGLFTTLKKMHTKNLLVSAAFSYYPAQFALTRLAERHNIPVSDIFDIEGMQIDPSIRIEVLNPKPNTGILNPKGRRKYAALSENNMSIVLKITYNEVSFLFTADIEKKGEQNLLRDKDRVKSAILKVAHHGSRRSTGRAFLKAVSPDVAVISAGYKNRFRHPHKAVIKRLKKQGVKIYRTDLDGAITISTDGNDICIDTFEKVYKPETDKYRCYLSKKGVLTWRSQALHLQG